MQVRHQQFLIMHARGWSSLKAKLRDVLFWGFPLSCLMNSKIDQLATCLCWIGVVHLSSLRLHLDIQSSNILRNLQVRTAGQPILHRMRSLSYLRSEFQSTLCPSPCQDLQAREEVRIDIFGLTQWFMFTIVVLDDDNDIHALYEFTSTVVQGLCQSILKISCPPRDFESLEIGKSIKGVENGEQKSYVASRIQTCPQASSLFHEILRRPQKTL